MGVVNVTPDSFSDGGKYFDNASAVRHAMDLIEQGADIIDVGGESTRPKAEPVSEEEELRRVMPVIEALVPQINIPLSIDTLKPGVARAAVRAGASIINDVGANRTDGEMWRIVAETGVGYVAMHMQGSPATMQVKPTYQDVVEEVRIFLNGKIVDLQAVGISPEQIILDVGIGFGKTLEHNLQLLGSLRRFTTLQRPLLLGVSRKSFISKLLGVAAEDRLPGALACTLTAFEAGVQMFRTHDVAATVQALRMAEAITL
ncbi:dihydropteroate synthase [Pedosphaera parvula]|nr:dihydropteroate synthase [Pedosphaera parvula]